MFPGATDTAVNGVVTSSPLLAETAGANAARMSDEEMSAAVTWARRATGLRNRCPPGVRDRLSTQGPLDHRRICQRPRRRYNSASIHGWLCLLNHNAPPVPTNEQGPSPAYPSRVSLYAMAGPGEPGDPGNLIAPTLIGAFDGWVDAGSAATVALDQLLDDAPAIATFDTDALFDYRARRPTLDIVDGRLALLDLAGAGHPPGDDRFARSADPCRTRAGRSLAGVRGGRARDRAAARRGRVGQPRGHPGGSAAYP